MVIIIFGFGCLISWLYKTAKTVIFSCFKTGLLSVILRQPESVAEEQELIFDGIEPIIPVMSSRSCIKIMRYLLLNQFLMQIAVDLIEEIRRTAVKHYVQRSRSDPAGHVNYSIVLPVFRLSQNDTQ